MAEPEGDISPRGADQNSTLEAIKSLVASGADLNQLDEDGRSRLHMAIGAGDFDLVQHLIKHGASVNVATYSKVTALHYAAERGDLRIAQFLVENKADIHAKDKDGRTVLHHAVEGGNHPKVVEYFLQKGVKIETRTKYGRGQFTALHQAVRHRNIAMVHLLLDHGAKIDAKSRNWETPLHIAVRQNDVEIVRLLLKRGASVHASDLYWNTALHKVNILVVDGESVKSGASRVKALKALSAIVKLFLNKGANINAKDNNGMSVLHYAAAAQDAIDVVRVLLQNGAHIEATDKTGRTALHCGCESIGVTQLLISHGADVDARTNDSSTALHLLAAAYSKPAWMRLLLEKGANVNAQDKRGMTPLHHAASIGESDNVRFLIANGASMDTLDKDGRSPLATAINSRDVYERTYLAIHALCDLGAKWDDACSRDARRDQSLARQWTRAIAQSFDPDRTFERLRRSGLRACVLHWTSQRAKDRAVRLTDFDKAIYDQGKGGVELYLDSLAKTTTQQIVRRRKICVVGPSESGKTSLVKSLSDMKSVLVHVDDRTIGIDLFALVFKDQDAAKSGTYEASIWDFAGQDIYRAAHSLYFSKQTLYLVFVNIQEYLSQLPATTTVDDAMKHTEHRLSRYVQERVFKWLRLVLARQPDAELVVVLSKADTVDAKTTDDVVADLQTRLGEWIARFVQENEGPTRAALAKGLDEFKQRQRLRISVTTQDGVLRAKEDVQQTVMETRERAFVMPLLYTRVLQAIYTLRDEATSSEDAAARTQKLLIPSEKLVDKLTHQIDGLKPHECRQILVTLHNLGDILWYEQEHRLMTAGVDTIVLDPRIMLDIVREVVDHNHHTDGGQLKHSLLCTFTLWGALCRQSEELVLFFKRLLQRFRLAYPVGNQEMAWDSDLIVPAYWKAKRLRVEGHDGENDTEVAVAGEAFEHELRWQYTLPAEVCETVFEQFVVLSYDVEYERAIDATVLHLSKPGQCSVRIHCEEGKKQTEDVIVLHVAARSKGECWAIIKELVLAMELVLLDYPGLGTVHRHLLMKKATGTRTRYNSYDLKRFMSDGSAQRINAATFALIQDKFAK